MSVTVTAAGETATADYTVGGAGLPLPAGWPTVSFFDDFTGSTVDAAKWNVRNNTWASNELSIDTNRPANVFVGNSLLTIRGQREQYTVGGTTRQYTSGYLDTIGKHSQHGGRWEIRCALPATKGAWGAFWLRGDSTLGEIDVLESVGGLPDIVETVHESTNGDQDKLGYDWKPTPGWSYTDLHTYAFEWDAATGAMRWYTDNLLRIARSVTDLGNPSKQPATWLNGPAFASPFNMRLNLQIGGSMPNSEGEPVDATSAFPADYRVDYVRALTR